MRRVAHVGVEIGKFEVFSEEVAVDPGELAKFFVEVALALRNVGIEGVEELFEAHTQIRAILSRAVTDEQLKGFRLEDTIVLSKEAEENADKQSFEFVPSITTRF